MTPQQRWHEWGDRSHEFLAYAQLFSVREVAEIFGAPLEAVTYWLWFEKKGLDNG